MLKKKKTAFTLIEMIIVISLTLIVIGITSSIFITGNRVFSDSDVNTTLQMEVQIVQEKISDIGMQGVGIYTIKDNNGNDEIEISNETFNITDLDYDNLKSKLTDSDGKINSIDISKNEWLAINEVKIYTYKEDEDGQAIKVNPISLLKYENTNNNQIGTGDLFIDGKKISSNIKEIKINISSNNTPLKNSNSILLKITIQKKKGFSNTIYPFFVNVKFRNGFIKNN